MAIDPDQILENALSAPKSVTNAAGERVDGPTAQETIALLEYAAGRSKRRLPFAVTRAIPGDTVGPNIQDE